MKFVFISLHQKKHFTTKPTHTGLKWSNEEWLKTRVLGWKGNMKQHSKFNSTLIHRSSICSRFDSSKWFSRGIILVCSSIWIVGMMPSVLLCVTLKLPGPDPALPDAAPSCFVFTAQPLELCVLLRPDPKDERLHFHPLTSMPNKECWRCSL